MLYQQDPVRGQEARAWLERAHSDLEAATILLDATLPPPYSILVYQSHQAVGRSLRAFLSWNDEPARKTDDMAELGAICVHLDATLTGMPERVGSLNRFATHFHNPINEPEPIEAETLEALALAHAVYEAVLQRLPPEVRPEEPR